MIIFRVVVLEDKKGKPVKKYGMSMQVFTDASKESKFSNDEENENPRIKSNFAKHLIKEDPQQQMHFEPVLTENVYKKYYEEFRDISEAALKEKMFSLNDLREEYKKYESVLKDFPYEEERIITKIRDATKKGDQKTAEDFNTILQHIISIKSDMQALKNKITKLESAVERNKKELDVLNEELKTVSSYPVLEAKYIEVRSKNETDIGIPNSHTEGLYHLDQDKVLEFMRKNPIKPADSKEKQARKMKAAILAGLDKELQKELKDLKIVPKDFFNAKFLESPASIEKWVTQLATSLHAANRKEKEKGEELTGARGKEEETEEKTPRIK